MGGDVERDGVAIVGGVRAFDDGEHEGGTIDDVIHL